MHRIARPLLWWGVMGGLLVSVSGCVVGPTSLRGNRPEYNKAVQRTEKEELLLNIVRVRYSEPVKFLQVTSVVSTFNYAAGLNASANLPFDARSGETRGPNVFNVGGSLAYAEAPTVTYVPLEGKQFASQLLQEVSVETLLLLIRSGWNIAQVMPIVVEHFGALSNIPGHSTYNHFLQLVGLLEKIQARGGLRFMLLPHAPDIIADSLPASAVDLKIFGTSGATTLALLPRDDGKFKLVRSGASQVMELQYANQEEAAQMAALLGSASIRPKGELVERIALLNTLTIPNVYSEPVTLITVALRSFTDQMLYVSRGVLIPPDDQAAVAPAGPAGPKLVDIHYSGSQPDNAYVAIPYRQHWFVIPDADIQSKATFALLLTIFSLSTIEAGTSPALSLPVGAGIGMGMLR